MFNAIVTPICSQLRSLALHNRQLTQARDLLLPRLMNGELNGVSDDTLANLTALGESFTTEFKRSFQSNLGR